MGGPQAFVAGVSAAAPVPCTLLTYLDAPDLHCPPPLHPRRSEVLYETGPDGQPSRVTGLRLSKAGQEQVVKADAYVAALDVPGAKRLIPQVRARSAVDGAGGGAPAGLPGRRGKQGW